MKKYIYIPLLLLLMVVATDAAMAQARISRTEFLCYDKREDAKRDVRTQIDKYIAIAPTLQFQSDEGGVRAVYEQIITVPASWNDYNAYLHTESIGDDYTIFINGRQISRPIDKHTPSELFISPYLDQGDNTIAIVVVAEPYMSTIAEDIAMSPRTQFSNCYIFAQRKLGIYDVNIRLLPDSLNRFAQLHLDVAVDNSFSTDETIEVGYDIYAPDGKLIDYSVNDLAMVGFSRDTMRFRPWVYNSNPNRWSPSNPKLYDLMLYTKRNGILWEYMPFKVGFVEYGYNDNGEITAFSKPLQLKAPKLHLPTHHSQSPARRR